MTGAGKFIQIEVVCATPERQCLLAIEVAVGSTARAAIAATDIADRFPEIDFSTCALGVFARQVNDDYILSDGERVEVYRPLANDPQVSRLARAAIKAAS